MSKIVVVYFSRSGTTAKLALELARKLDADVERVNSLASYKGARGYLKGVWQALRAAAPPVAPARDVTAYSLVVIGTPVWAGRLSPPMRSYLQSLGGRIERTAAFWVSGSGAPYQSIGAEIARLTRCSPVATASFSQREVDRGTESAKLDSLARALRSPLPRAA